jgi:hypothetical protein
VRSGIRAGAKFLNRGERVAGRAKATGLSIRSGVRAGGVNWGGNRCERLACRP